MGSVISPEICASQWHKQLLQNYESFPLRTLVVCSSKSNSQWKYRVTSAGLTWCVSAQVKCPYCYIQYTDLKLETFTLKLSGDSIGGHFFTINVYNDKMTTGVTFKVTKCDNIYLMN